jgi:aminoglycoside phosphotransferase
MVDFADDADNQIEQELTRNLSRRLPQLNRDGFCHYCGDEIGEDAIFCDNAQGDDLGCAKDWQDIQLAKQRIGN